MVYITKEQQVFRSWKITAECSFVKEGWEKELMRKSLRESMEWASSKREELSEEPEEEPPLSIVASGCEESDEDF